MEQKIAQQTEQNIATQIGYLVMQLEAAKVREAAYIARIAELEEAATRPTEA